jgi:VIT1/CCC1 family predicted Fe2+/Mn2+ transporter
MIESELVIVVGIVLFALGIVVGVLIGEDSNELD